MYKLKYSELEADSAILSSFVKSALVFIQSTMHIYSSALSDSVM